METTELIEALGYLSSPNFLSAERLGEVPEHAHVFSRAERWCGVQGVYLLRDGSGSSSRSPSIPVVYVAEAECGEAADEVHRRVWNQSIVPFLIVRLPGEIRLYSGFRYRPPQPTRSGRDEQRGVLEPTIPFDQVTTKLAAFRAGAIDDGTLWRARGRDVDPDSRVDRRLLDNLEELGNRLHSQGLEREVAHALIGKFVYFRYLRDRKILSDRKLREWELEPTLIFGRQPNLEEITTLDELLDDWLNGSVFPLRLSGKGPLRPEHIRQVAAVFLGDQVRSGQLHLDFQAYDFSHIPIETLSVIYEQFLAIEGRRRQTGAYYTPLTIVNFMLAELHSHRPLRLGMRVLDPACGSGAFLVQCYRRFIDLHVRENGGRKLRPSELRELLVKHIYGVDRDPDACRVAELSLILTMLDYIEPPDLQRTPTFKLPILQNNNIFEADFFDPDSRWEHEAKNRTYDWIVGNPPWIELRSGEPEKNPHALRWMASHRQEYPVGRNQLAEAFAWKAALHTSADGLIGLLLPAMTLFKSKSRSSPGFRSAFFRAMTVAAIGNFSNLREVLFDRRARLPAAAFFYAPLRSEEYPSDRPILIFSPLVANQEANRPFKLRARQPTWNITIDASEVRAVPLAAAASGESVPWMMAMWGSGRDQRLLAKTSSRFPTLSSFATARDIKIHPGLELRESSVKTEELEELPVLRGKNELKMEELRKRGRIYDFPPSALKRVPPGRRFVRKKGGKKPLAVCYPPHVILSGARNFAVFHDDFVVVPPRQIAIAGPREQESILRALSLYLSSDFAIYYEFLSSPQWRVREGRSTLETLKRLPVPLAALDAGDLQRWCDLQKELAAASARGYEGDGHRGPLFSRKEMERDMESLEREMNQAVNTLLGLDETQQYLVHDLVHVRRHLCDGKVAAEAVREPNCDELVEYAAMLRDELDAFLDAELGLAHRISVFDGPNSGAVEIELLPRGKAPEQIEVVHTMEPVTRKLNRTGAKGLPDQWLYFERNLFLYERGRNLIFKPKQRLWWTRSQALNDADEIIAAALAPEASE